MKPLVIAVELSLDIAKNNVFRMVLHPVIERLSTYILTREDVCFPITPRKGPISSSAKKRPIGPPGPESEIWVL